MRFLRGQLDRFEVTVEVRPIASTRYTCSSTEILAEDLRATITRVAIAGWH